MIGTFEFSRKIKIERKRPNEFYEQLKKSNEFLKKIQSCSENINYVDVGSKILNLQDENELSYDAVHFTKKGHDLVMSICLKEILKIC